MAGNGKGLFLVIEGSDGVGKSSQVSLLAEYFRKTGRKTRSVHFPRLEALPYGEIIAAYLRGEFGSLEQVHPRLAALLFALDRREAAGELRNLIDSGAVVLADRYILSNLAYQGGRSGEQTERNNLQDWIEVLEYGRHAIPRPDFTLWLDVPPRFSRARIAAPRSGEDRTYLRGAEDIHEKSRTLQERAREEFLRLVAARPGEMTRVDCWDTDGGMADAATVHERILDVLRRYALV